jgi:adenosine deaminase
MYERQVRERLRELAERNVMIEICLTSDATIFDIHGERHPLHQHFRPGVPVALATGRDAGVSTRRARSEPEIR